MNSRALKKTRIEKQDPDFNKNSSVFDRLPEVIKWHAFTFLMGNDLEDYKRLNAFPKGSFIDECCRAASLASATQNFLDNKADQMRVNSDNLEQQEQEEKSFQHKAHQYPTKQKKLITNVTPKSFLKLDEKKYADSNLKSSLFKKVASAIVEFPMASYLDAKSLAAFRNTCWRTTTFFQKQLPTHLPVHLETQLKPLLQAVVYADFDQVKKRVLSNPGLLYHAGVVVDYSGRTCEGTALRLALAAKDYSRSCRLFLMATPENRNYERSNIGNIYLYLDKENKIFYMIDDEIVYLDKDKCKYELNESIRNAKFDQPAWGRKRCRNKAICEFVFKITLERMGHPHEGMVEWLEDQLRQLPYGEEEIKKQKLDQFPEGFEQEEKEKQERDSQALKLAYQAINANTIQDCQKTLTLDDIIQEEILERKDEQLKKNDEAILRAETSDQFEVAFNELKKQLAHKKLIEEPFNFDVLKAIYQFRNQLYPKKKFQTGFHFNEQLQIEANDLYDNYFDAFSNPNPGSNNDYWNAPKTHLAWRKINGYINRYYPACLAQAAAQGFHYVNEEKFKRSFQFKWRYSPQDVFFPLDQNLQFRLGYHCAFEDGTGPEEAGMIHMTGPNGFPGAFESFCRQKNAPEPLVSEENQPMPQIGCALQ